MKNRILRRLLQVPIINRKSPYIFRKLGCTLAENARLSTNVHIKGAYSYIHMARNAEINDGVFLLLKAPLYLGENSTIAYHAKIITSANPNTPYNELGKIYPSKTAPVIIGKNVWIGAGAIILPGVTIGDFSVVAAGAVVTKDVPSGVMVAGVPSKIVKYIQ